MKRIIIAIDGYSSCGKSSFAKAIAARYGYIFIDTGAMYRAVTLYAIRCGYLADEMIDRGAIIGSLSDINITLEASAEGNTVILNGCDVSEDIRSLEVNSFVSIVSSIAEVRHRMVTLQQAMGENRGVVMDGRDIGTVVFPNAELKIFMTASADVRAQRRHDEMLAKGQEYTLNEIKANLLERDHIDQTREESPLCMADDAILLDNSNMTIAQQMEWVDEIINNIMLS